MLIKIVKTMFVMLRGGSEADRIAITRCVITEIMYELLMDTRVFGPNMVI